MRIKRVKIRNFFFIEKVDLSLDDDVYFILGRNRDDDASISNGAGKSTFCHAILWGLFGKTLGRGTSKKDLIGPFDKKVFVEVEVEKDGKEIRVERLYDASGGNLKLFIDGQDHTQHGKKKTDARILQQLDMKEETIFKAAYFDESEEPFVALTPAKLSNYVEEVLDLSRFYDYRKNIRKKRDDFENNRDKKLDKISYKEESLEELDEDVSFLQDEFEKNKKEKEQKIEQKKKEIENIEEKIEQKEDIVSNVGDIEEDIKLVEKLKEYKSQGQKSKDKWRDVQSNYVDKKHEVEDKISSIEYNIKNHEDKIDNIDDAIDNLSIDDESEDTCNYCGNLLKNSDDIEQKKQEFIDKKESLQDDIKDFEKQKVKEEERFDSLTQKVQRARNIFCLVEGFVSNIDEEICSYSDIEKKKNKIDTAKKRIKDLKKDKQKNKKALDEYKNKSYDHIKEKIQSKEEKIEDLKDEKKQLQKECEQLDEKMKACDDLEQAIENIRSKTFNSFVKSLNESIDQTLQEMTKGSFQSQIVHNDGKLSFEFINANKTSFCHYDQFSSGQQRRISKAVALALNHSLDIGFLIDDEGLTHLDAEGARDILNYILDTFEGGTLFFVSHDPYVQNHFQNVRKLVCIKEHGRISVEKR